MKLLNSDTVGFGADNAAATTDIWVKHLVSCTQLSRDVKYTVDHT